MVRYREGTTGDIEAITAIYNHYIRTTAITFDIDEKTVADRRNWFDQFTGSVRHRLFVADDDGAIAGYACSTAYRPRRAYETTVETTIYLAPEATGRGLGRALYGVLLESIETADVHRALGVISLPNPASEALHRAVGFTETGRLSEVGRKFGRYWDVAIYEKAIGRDGGL